jgi:hypothetical protein
MLIMDMDTPVYRAAGAAQKTQEDGSITVEPFSHAAHNMDLFITSVLNKFPEHEYVMYLTAAKDKHYRYDIYPEYKANRKAYKRPVHYGEVREYLIKKYGAIIVEDMEADDALAIAMCHHIPTREEEVTSQTPIAVYIDKDLDQIPGWRFKYKHSAKSEEKLYYVDQIDALKSFYKQMFKGDSSDNVKNLIFRKTWKHEVNHIFSMQSEVDMYKLLHNSFRTESKLSDEEVRELLTKRGRILWLQRFKGDMWNPPLMI